MSYDVRVEQARCAALGCDPGAIDGIRGRKTRQARSDAEALQAARRLPFIHPSGLSRVHIHWTGGGHRASGLDRNHYHVLIEGDGTVIRAHAPIVRLAHTLNANGGAIAVSLCAMGGAVEKPFWAGKYPITEPQLAELARVVADLCTIYDIPVSRTSVLTHAEVQPTLGIKQRGKWDIAWLPGMTAPRDPVAVGDILRSRIRTAPL